MATLSYAIQSANMWEHRLRDALASRRRAVGSVGKAYARQYVRRCAKYVRHYRDLAKGGMKERCCEECGEIRPLDSHDLCSYCAFDIIAANVLWEAEIGGAL